MIMTTLNSASIDKDGGIGYYKNNQINRENTDWFFFLYPWLVLSLKLYLFTDIAEKKFKMPFRLTVPKPHLVFMLSNL